MAAKQPLRGAGSLFRRARRYGRQHIAGKLGRFRLTDLVAYILHRPGVMGDYRRRRPKPFGKHWTGPFEYSARKAHA